jgi:hypothetical protein
MKRRAKALSRLEIKSNSNNNRGKDMRRDEKCILESETDAYCID